MLARYVAAFGVSTAIHLAIALCLVDTARVLSSRPPDRGVEVVLLPPAEDATFHGVKPVARADPGWQVGDVSGEGQLGGADLDRIAAHVAVLFPFVTPGLDLEAFFPAAVSASRLTFENPFAKKIVAPPRRRRPALDLTPAAIQTIVDGSWTRARRWTAFDTIRRYCVAYDADDPRLAALVASYRDQDALQPYADGALRDLRVWAQLGLAADHISFIGFVRDYAVAHPHTKVATELLLLIDTIAQANEDALAVLVETDLPGDLQWTLRAHPRAYALAEQIQRQYAKALARRGLTSRSAVEEYYERGRLALLARVLTATPAGYRANDVRFLIGSILWKQAKREDAMRAWRDLTPALTDSYAIAIAQLRSAVATSPSDVRNIDDILKNQQGRWLSFSYERLRRFGYKVDSF